MQHLTLINTPLFQAFYKDIKPVNIEKAYNEFIDEVWHICCNTENAKSMVLTMTYTEIELQHLLERGVVLETHKRYIKKMIEFIHKILERIHHYNIPVAMPLIPSSTSSSKIKEYKEEMCRWTGNSVDLVELVYGLTEAGCIDSGDKPLHLIIKQISTFFGVDIKDCYGMYIDIKRRKNTSRTYFLDKMRERLNQRMQRDDEKERMRK